jgi:dihydrofolate reductase
MRKIVLYIACSLDGYIARTDGSVDWLFTDQDYGYTAFLGSVDTVMMGRKTYDQVLTFGPYPYSGKAGYVVSRSRAGTRDENVVFVGPDIAGFVRRLREEAGRNIWIVGGSELVDLFLKERLIDEFIISIHPVVLGSGIPLFRKEDFETWLTLMKCEQFPGGLVQLHYETRENS